MMRITTTTVYYLACLLALLCGVVMPYELRAQCGALGDPIVDVNFGTSSGPDFGEGRTTYRYVNGGPSDGQYTLSRNANFNNGWHHMPDRSGSGYMLVVNADNNTAGEFYRIPVSGLCEYTDFYFSAFIANVNRPEQQDEACDGNPLRLPNVKFLILDGEGNRIDSIETGDIPVSSSPQWNEYGIHFNTGGHTEFQLVLINNNIGGCGNDLAIDDIQFRPCGPVIELIPHQGVRQMDTLFFCEETLGQMVFGSHVELDESYSTNPVYQWQTRYDEEEDWTDISGETESQLTIVPQYGQWFRLTAAASVANLDEPLCRIASDYTRITRLILPESETDISHVNPICGGELTIFDPPEYVGEHVGPLTYQWQSFHGNSPFTDVADADASDYTFQSATPGTYRFRRQAINSCGDRFITHVYEVEVQEVSRTTFELAQQTICVDAEPILLTGGLVLNGDGASDGVYSGSGVLDGYFHPGVAGIGQHVITFSPPLGTLCIEPSQSVITVIDSVSLDPMEDMVILPGQTVTLYPQTNATLFDWGSQPGLDNYHTPYPNASPNETTTYTLIASNEAGCEKTGEITITVLEDLIIPNAFTPNGDGANDVWEIDGLNNYPNAFIQVFNRWGDLVFSSRGYPIPWDGQFKGNHLPAATYYYTISSDALERPLSGAITILR